MVVAGVEGPDLTARALTALREAGWDHAPIRVEVEKLIPVAAGLGGGSADAAAVLRLARDRVPDERIEAIARGIGADVSSQLDPAFCLVGGAGRGDRAAAAPAPVRGGVDPRPGGAADAGRLRRGRPARHDPHPRWTRRCSPACRRRDRGRGRIRSSTPSLLVNDLAPAALALRPSISVALGLLVEVGAAVALVTGSGPTAVGLFEDRDRAVAAGTELRAAGHEAIVASSVESI